MKDKLATGGVVVVGFIVLGVCAWRKVDTATIAAISAALLALAGAMKPYLGNGNGDSK